MKQIFIKALDNLASYPGAYSVIALSLAVVIVVIPQIPSDHRLLAFIIFIIPVLVVILQLHKIDKSSQESRSADIRDSNIVSGGRLIVFPAAKNNQYNVRFYRFLFDQFRRAKKNIYVSADGMGCTDKEGIKLAEQLIEGYRDALSKNVQIVRVETKTKSNSIWAKMLADLKNDFGKQFELHILKENRNTQLTSVSVYDPQSLEENAIVLLMSMRRLFGTRAADLAGTAIFIEREERLACDLRDRIMDLRKSSIAVSPRTPEDVINELTEN